MARRLCSAYVVCHDDPSETVARELQASFPGVVRGVVRVAPSPLFESAAFPRLAELEPEWQDSRFVGLLPYSIRNKAAVALEKLEAAIEACCRQEGDVLGLVLYRCTGDLVHQAVQWHGADFLRAWHALIENTLGANAAAFACTANVPKFFANAWIARADAMRDYLPFVVRCGRELTTCPELAALVDVDARYRGALDAGRLRDIFGRSHYCLHPFIMERLPCFYFAFRGYRVVTPQYL